MPDLQLPTRAAKETAAAHGITPDRCEILQNGSTLVLRLTDTLVARVVQDLQGPRSGSAWFERENAVTQYLAGHGAPVIPMHPALPPGPHEHLGYTLNFMPAIAAPPAASPSSYNERMKRFGLAIDAIRVRVESEMGSDDVVHLRRMNRFSRGMEVIGRAMIHFSFEPVGFLAGVGALWLHKQLQAIEIGHTVLHGVYDKLPGAERFSSKTFSWDTPIHEGAWKQGHNVMHHHYTNVAGKDPDTNFGPARLTEHTPHNFLHRLQFPFLLAVLAPNFTFFMNLHFTGLNDLYFGNGRADDHHAPQDRSWKTIKDAHVKALRKYLPYYSWNYIFFPLLAGSMFWKVLLGNWMAETLRDLYSAATIYCGHIGEEVADFTEGTRANGKGEWYAMQVESTNNFEVWLPISILCGGLDRQIEHHLFPKIPPNRIRKVSAEVRAVCEAHGVTYRTGSWWSTLKKALAHMRDLSICDLARAAV